MKDLQDMETQRIQRLPALLFDNSLTNLDEVGLDQYKILNNEPLHNISHHTQSLYGNAKSLPLKYTKNSLKKLYSNRSVGKMQKIHLTTERVC